jgi:tetratricopeptide (TPR) repeat protein
MAGGVNMRKILPVLLIIFLVFSPVGGEEENRTIDTITMEELIKENDYVLSLDPHNLTALEFRSLIFFNEGKYPEAINASEQCLKVDPSCSFAWHVIGSSWGYLNQPDKAVEAFQKVVALNPGDPVQYNVQGVALSRTGEFDKAVQAFQKATSINPGYAAAWNNLGVTYYNMKEYDKALSAFDRAISFNPGYPVIYANKGYAFLQKGDYGGALSISKIARNMDLTCVPSWFISGESQYHNRNWKEAFYSFDGGFNALVKNEIWYYQGAKNTRITKDMQPMDAYYVAIASNVRYTGVWERTTVINYKIKRYQETIDLYDQILAITPDYAEGWKKKGDSAIKIKRIESARDSYKRALDLLPNDPEVLASYGYTTGLLGDYLEAMKYINKALEIEPGYSRGHLYKGLVYSFYGEREDAISSFLKGLEYEGEKAELYDALANVQFKNGDTIGGAISTIRSLLGF